MIYGVYAVRDLKTGYLSPMVESNDAAAVRGFKHAATKVESLFFTSPADYQFFRIGTYDTDDGVLISEDHKLLASASDFVKEE